MKNKDNKIILFFTVLLVVAFLLCLDLPFFWDAVTKAGRANWILENHFKTFIVPSEFNSGHPPLWIGALAVFWAIFGKSIWVARILLLIVNWGVFYQLFLLCKKLFDKKVSIWFFFLVAAEATLVAQTTNLNNDMLLLFFGLLALNSVLVNKWGWCALALVGMLMTNLRGLYFIFALLIIQIILHRKQYIEASKKMVVSYGLAIFVFLIFVFYQYSELGWAVISSNNSYAEHRQSGSMEVIMHNVAALMFHLSEYGRIFLWLALIVLMWFGFKKWGKELPLSIQKPIILFLIFMGVLTLGFVPFTNPIGPRYFIVGYILATILFLNLLHTLPISKQLRKICVTCIALGFLTGHLWVYPATIDQAWDSNLAYVNYYSVKDDMLAYIEASNIPEQDIGTNIRTRHLYSFIDDEPKGVENFTPLNLETNPYVLFSNIENTTSDAEIETLRNSWIEIKTFSQMGVFVTLYKNPKFQ